MQKHRPLRPLVLLFIPLLLLLARAIFAQQTLDRQSSLRHPPAPPAPTQSPAFDLLTPRTQGSLIDLPLR
jgi:hypothetical protein